MNSFIASEMIPVINFHLGCKQDIGWKLSIVLPFCSSFWQRTAFLLVIHAGICLPLHYNPFFNLEMITHSEDYSFKNYWENQVTSIFFAILTAPGIVIFIHLSFKNRHWLTNDIRFDRGNFEYLLPSLFVFFYIKSFCKDIMSNMNKRIQRNKNKQN